jgi:hypothetical protein
MHDIFLLEARIFGGNVDADPVVFWENTLGNVIQQRDRTEPKWSGPGR